MTITAKNIGRINIWPTYDVARDADIEESKFVGQLTVWRTNEEARANISHEEEGGGGGAPDWVPENAKIHIDFVGGTPQGRAWVQGTGEVDVDTLLGADPNTEGVWGASEYDADNLGPDGYVGAASRYIAFIGAARTLILSGTTLRYSIYSSGDTYPDSLASLVSAPGAHNLDVAIASPCTAESWGGTINDENMFANEGVSAYSNALAWTITATRFEYAISGSEAVAHAITEADYPLSGANQIVAALIGIENSLEYLQSITLYNPLPDTTGLSELSEPA